MKSCLTSWLRLTPYAALRDDRCSQGGRDRRYQIFKITRRILTNKDDCFPIYDWILRVDSKASSKKTNDGGEEAGNYAIVDRPARLFVFVGTGRKARSGVNGCGPNSLQSHKI